MTTLSRRHAMLTSAGALAAGLTTSRAKAAITGEDPILALHRQILAIRKQAQPGNEEHERLREILVSRYGSPLEGGLRVTDVWRGDPLNARLMAIDDALTKLVTAETDVLHQLILTQPTTEAGLRLKVNLMKQQMYTDIEDMDTVEAFPFVVLNDCLKMLGQPTI